MVTLTINIDEDTATRLQRQAMDRGTTIDELLAAAAEFLLGPGEGYELTDEQEAALIEADAEIDRGELVTTEELFAKLKALRG